MFSLPITAKPPLRLRACQPRRGWTGVSRKLLTKTTYQGSTTNYVYNAANRLVMLQNPDYTQVDYQYDPAGRLLSRVTANGARMTQQFDANGWLTRLDQYDATNALVSSTTYTRDRVGNITGQTDASGTTTFAMDALYRLTQADYPGAANDELFTYDKVGNIKTTTKGSLTANANTRYYNYTAGTNRLAEIRIGSTSGTLESGFTNDFEGRLTAQTGTGAKTLTWDAKGRVKTVGAETYRYDPMDYRIGRSGGSLGNRSYFLEGEHLESEYSGSLLQAKYFRGVSTDELVAAWMYDTDSKLKPFLFHQDQVTSVTAVSGHNGGTTQGVKYSAFGVPQSTTGSSPNRLKYTGREEDGTGLYYYRARHYDPAIGRFISEDPKGFDAGINFYAYVGNNPTNANDPSGLEAYLGAKPISGFPDKKIAPHHTVIVLIPSNPSEFANRTGWKDLGNGYIISTLSAQPKDGASATTFTGNSQLVYTPNWPADQIQNLTQLQRIPTPPGMTDTQHISGLINSAAGYRDTARYTLTPEKGGGTFLTAGYNSNSFTAGVMGTPPPIDYSAPGYDKPLPLSVGATGTWGTGASGSWGGAAGGGFLLYPNKSNTNTMRSVYSK
ncbi:RHS repeat-associated core domain-containing protein [Rhodocyclus gracilis]|uniref:RHS repeat-associated core domain-containing protein n=1 Tax=Rhodocyclus gracilis TaxID=2929842 RepID=UPI001E3AA336|nr:RHS repeat-associated core domain-containing protein [Rhodocyclus gracilis]